MESLVFPDFAQQVLHEETVYEVRFSSEFDAVVLANPVCANVGLGKRNQNFICGLGPI
jgi:hypothetical protein